MGKKKQTNTNANQDPNLDPDGTQSTNVGEASQGNETPGDANTPTETKTSETGDQTNPQGSEESTKDSEGSQDSGVDTEGKGETTPTKGVATKVKSDIEAIAKKTFERYPLDTLYFTSDMQGFGNPTDAAHHANKLADKAVYEVKRSEDGK